MEKGQMAGVGGLIMLAIAVIVGAILLQGSAQNISTVVNTQAVANDSLGTVENSSTVYLTSYRALSDVVVYNDTNSVVADTEYSITNNVIDPTTGGLSVLFTADADDGDNQTGNTWYISGTAQPTAYGDNASRSITALIIIMMALAIAAVAIGYAVKSYAN